MLLLLWVGAIAQPSISSTTQLSVFNNATYWAVDFADIQDYVLTGGSWNGNDIDLGQLAQGGATTGQILKWNGTTWAAADEAGGGGGAPTNAQYLVLATDATLTNERVFTPGANVDITDGGSGGNYTLAAGTKAVTRPGDLTPADITANVDNYSPSGLADASVLRLNVTSNANMSGLSGGSDGREMVVYCTGSATLTLLHESGSSTAANRFVLPGDASMTLVKNQGAQFIYDATQSRWVCVGMVSARGEGVLVYEYTTAQTNTDLTIPAGALSFEILAIGGGGGGGSGRKGAAGSVRCGGGGGGAGAVVLQTFAVSDYGETTLRINIPAAAAGGASQSTNSSNGNNGTTPSDVTVGTTSGVFISIAGGGTRGLGGTASAGTGGTAASKGMFFGAAGANASVTGGGGSAGNNSQTLGAGGGAAGGGITTANVSGAGNGGGAGYYNSILGGSAGTAGTEPTAGRYTGGGGGSGAASTTGNATSGGAGALGAGGGGGGASVDSVGNSGAGGAGGIGYVKITFFF